MIHIYCPFNNADKTDFRFKLLIGSSTHIINTQRKHSHISLSLLPAIHKYNPTPYQCQTKTPHTTTHRSTILHTRKALQQMQVEWGGCKHSIPGMIHIIYCGHANNNARTQTSSSQPVSQQQNGAIPTATETNQRTESAKKHCAVVVVVFVWRSSLGCGFMISPGMIKINPYISTRRNAAHFTVSIRIQRFARDFRTNATFLKHTNTRKTRK